MNDILLINPYNPDSDHIQPPLGLGYLASSLTRQSINVSILDANKEKIRADDLPEILKKYNPDIIGLQFYTLNASEVKKALTVIKKLNKNIVTLVGGPHPSALPRETFNLLGNLLDFAFSGEAEIGLPMLIKSLCQDKRNFNKIPGLIYQNNGRVIVNQPYFYPHLDDFGEPSWNLLKPETYPEAQHGAFFKNFPISPIITSRGCPFDCTFCAGKLNSGKTLRKRSASLVLKEIDNLYQKRGIREFHFIDDNFTLDHRHAVNIIRGIIKLDLKASFAVPNGVRLDTLDEELLSLMKKAGFYLISVGIESGSDKVLKKMHKHLMTGLIREKIKLIKKFGLDVAGFFVLGFPGETAKDIKETIRFSLSLGLLRANFFLFLPLPGTQTFKELMEINRLSLNEIYASSFTNAKSYCQVSSDKLKRLQKTAFLKFYSRPDILFKNLFLIRRPKQVVYLLKRAFHWLF